MADGWIKLHRSLMDHWVFKNPEYLKAWIDLLLLANYEDKKIPYKGSIITCKRGDVNISISELAKRWKWSRDKTRRFIMLLECDKMLVVNATTHRTTLTIVNYGKMQDLVTTNKATSKATSRQQASQQADTTKKDKKDKKDKKEYVCDIKDDEWDNPLDMIEREKGNVTI